MSIERKYTPATLADYGIYDPRLKLVLAAYRSGKADQPLLLHGPAGTGKSLLGNLFLRSICADAEPGDIRLVKAASETSIDDIRSLEVFCDVVKFNSMDYTGVLLDEVDGLSTKALDSLKPLLQQYAAIPNKRVQFVLTTNHLSKLPAPVVDRCIAVRVDDPKADDLVDLAARIMKAEGNPLDKDYLGRMLRHGTIGGYLSYRNFFHRITLTLQQFEKSAHTEGSI